MNIKCPVELTADKRNQLLDIVFLPLTAMQQHEAWRQNQSMLSKYRQSSDRHVERTRKQPEEDQSCQT